MPRITSVSLDASKRNAHTINEKFREQVFTSSNNDKLTGFSKFCFEFHSLNPGLDFKFRLVNDHGETLYSIWLTNEAWELVKIPEGYSFDKASGFSDGTFKSAVFVGRRRITNYI